MSRRDMLRSPSPPTLIVFVSLNRVRRDSSAQLKFTWIVPHKFSAAHSPVGCQQHRCTYRAVGRDGLEGGRGLNHCLINMVSVCFILLGSVCESFILETGLPGMTLRYIQGPDGLSLISKATRK